MNTETKPKQRNVVVYARVSTEHEAQLSALENQKDWYKPFVEAHPEWKIVRMYVDEGITGTSAKKRPQFIQMIEDAKSGEFDLILTREVSRFARNTVDTLQYTRTLKAMGVEVFFINDNIKTFDGDGELRLTIMATLAQDESRKTSIRVKAGQQTSMDNGVLYGNGNILGYDRVGKNLVINPEQAKTVRMIFDWYLNGHGVRQIQYMLEGAGRLTSAGKTNWHCTVISKILKNSFYCGIITYHKQFVPDYLEQKKINNHGEVEVTRVRGKHEPIISEEEYFAVQRRLSKNTTSAGGDVKGKLIGVKPSSSVWSEILICECGHKFLRKTWRKTADKTTYGYQCAYSHRTGSVRTRMNKGLSLDGVCRSPMIPEWKLQVMAKYIFNYHIKNSHQIVSLAESMLAKHIDDKEEVDNSAEISRLEKQREKLLTKINNLIEMRSDGDIDRDTFVAKKTEAEIKIHKLNKEIDELLPRQDEEINTTSEERLSILRYYLEQSVDPDGKEDIPDDVIRAFIRKVVVHENSYDWYLRFDDNGNPDNSDSPKSLDVEGRKNSVDTSVLETTNCLLQHRLQSAKIGSNSDIFHKVENPEFTHIYDTVIVFSDALKAHNLSKQRKGYWTDLNVSVFI